jgi:NaMN:DMB phosphoribosyltransferase
MIPPPADLASLGAEVAWTDHDAGERTRTVLDGRGAGRLAELAGWLSAAQGASPPALPARARLLVFGPCPDVIAGLADQCGAGLRQVGADALPEGTVGAAIAAGASIADDEIDSGTDLLAVALPAEGLRPVTVAVATSLLTAIEPARTLPRGAAAVDADAWMARAIEVRDTRRSLATHRHDPDALLAGLADPLFAAAAACVLRAAARRTPVVLDGPAATVAALLAYEAQPRAVRWWLAADTPGDPAHRAAAQTLSLQGALDLATSSGAGATGLLAITVLRAACRLATEGSAP